MELSPRERRCIELACDLLGKQFDSIWTIPDGPTLAAQQRDGHTPPTPETIVTDGAHTAAVEVKSLSGDSAWRAYRESIQSLRRYLTPSCGGYYYVNGCVDLRMPLDKKLRRILR